MAVSGVQHALVNPHDTGNTFELMLTLLPHVRVPPLQLLPLPPLFSSASLSSVHDRLFAQHTTSSVHKDCRVPEFQADALDIALDSKYNQHESFLAGKTAVLKQAETDQVRVIQIFTNTSLQSVFAVRTLVVRLPPQQQHFRGM